MNLNEQTKQWRLYQAEKEPVLIRHKDKFIWPDMEKVCCAGALHVWEIQRGMKQDCIFLNDHFKKICEPQV